MEWCNRNRVFSSIVILADSVYHAVAIVANKAYSEQMQI